MENGTLLLQNNNENVYELFVKYLNNPVMTKLSVDDTTNLSYYYVKKASQLMNINQYIIISVYNDRHPINTTIKLENIRWQSLQTRELEKNYNIQKVFYNNSSILDNYILNIQKRDNNISVYYNNELDIHVYLHHTEENNVYEYPNKATLTSAIETFRTIIKFT